MVGCISFILLYARKRGVPFNALNARNLTQDKIKQLTPINTFAIMVGAIYLVVRFSAIDHKILIYNGIVLPLFAITMMAFFLKIIRFKATR